MSVSVSAVVLRAEDPARLASFYTRHAGVVLSRGAGDFFHGELPLGRGATLAFAIVRGDALEARAGRSVMLTCRVDDLEEFLRGLAEDGITPERRVEEEHGRFAYVADPEGNPLELWEEKLS